MRKHPTLLLPGATVCVMAAAVLAGCSSGGGPPTSPAPQPSATEQTTSAGPPPPGDIGMSPDGVTTRVDVPAESTEEQYAQACRAAKEWMDSQGGDRNQLVEPFLKQLQASAESGPATFNSTWAQLSAAQQAAVIVAVQAGADGACG